VDKNLTHLSEFRITVALINPDNRRLLYLSVTSTRYENAVSCFFADYYFTWIYLCSQADTNHILPRTSNDSRLLLQIQQRLGQSAVNEPALHTPKNKGKTTRKYIRMSLIWIHITPHFLIPPFISFEYEGTASSSHNLKLIQIFLITWSHYYNKISISCEQVQRWCIQQKWHFTNLIPATATRMRKIGESVILHGMNTNLRCNFNFDVAWTAVGDKQRPPIWNLINMCPKVLKLWDVTA
jgi:hypothetical protein